MAFNPLPATWIPNISEDGTNITVPIASFPELTAAEVDVATGDIRKFMFAFLDKMWTSWNALASADRPAKMTLAKSASIDTATGVTTYTYIYTFKTSTTAQEVVAE